VSEDLAKAHSDALADLRRGGHSFVMKVDYFTGLFCPRGDPIICRHNSAVAIVSYENFFAGHPTRRSEAWLSEQSGAHIYLTAISKAEQRCGVATMPDG
jgi:hypothetical protein